MIYVDSSALLAAILAEDRKPPAGFWDSQLVASRLIEYETWTRLHALKLVSTHAEAARARLARLAFLEMSPTVLARALDPFPSPVRTLDALHLASVEFLRGLRVPVTLATYDGGMARAAARMGVALEKI